ncbi:hypothetical protein HYV82_06615 [Candidatus Woesearchaeota archaeon]|nr:hypothetical protein [Candidatus Woesearchaeota archaeon]
MNSFEYYVEKGEVRKASGDPALAKSLTESADRRMRFISRQPINNESATIIHEQVYDALRELLDSILSLEGYKSYSHIASIAYLRKFTEFNYDEINKLNMARQKRNNSKYYGAQTTPEETQEILALYRLIRPKIDKKLKDLARKPV